MNDINFNLKNGSTLSMALDEFVRWVCLCEGVSEVKQKCIELGMMSSDDSWVKPLAFQKYINERFHSAKHDIIAEIMLEGV
jgi:hypothetical protein